MLRRQFTFMEYVIQMRNKVVTDMYCTIRNCIFIIIILIFPVSEYTEKPMYITIQTCINVLDNTMRNMAFYSICHPRMPE